MADFINPYNFFPLSKESPDRSAGTKESRTYTGVIKYTVLTKTPLFIPNTSNTDALQMHVKDHKSYDFFTYTDLSGKDGPSQNALPVIPGSEMRGMLRSNFEILTNSCMSAIDDDIVLSKRTSERFKPGLINKGKNGKYKLFEAEDCIMRTKGENNLEDDENWGDDEDHNNRKCYVQDEIKEGTKVYFSKIDRIKGKSLAQNVSTQEEDKKEEGYIIKGEDGPEMKNKNGMTMKQRKHCCHIFCLKSKREGSDISLDPLDAVLNEYKKNGEHLYEEYSHQLEKFKNGELCDNDNKPSYFPVYYSIIKKDLIMLSPACITREIYLAKLEDMIGIHRPCNQKDKLCPACKLFGTVVNKNKAENGENFAIASRIRVSDLTCLEKSPSNCFMDKITLAPLSTPKLNNMEFYLKRPDHAWFWTYDYNVDENGNLEPKTGMINGRKFYWHQKNPDLKSYEPSNLNITIRPVKAGIKFEGKLFFQDLSKTELDQLIFLLNAQKTDASDSGEYSDINEKKHGYKLGGAKPFGFGSIAISVDDVELRSIGLNENSRTVERIISRYEDYEDPAFDSEILKNFEIMTDFNKTDETLGKLPVQYPRFKNSPNIYDWFTKNHAGYTEKNGEKTFTKSPNSRKKMAYREYMKAMDPELQETGYNQKVKKV